MISPPSISAILRDDAIHEFAIVRRHQQRAGQRLEKVLEPDDRFDVQVVRRFVHQQHVRTAEQDARHRDAHLPAAGQLADVAIDPVVVEPETEQHFARLAFERIAAEVIVFLLHFAEALENLIHLLGLSGVGHRVLERFEFVMQIADASAAGNRFVEHGTSGHFLHVLPEISDRQLFRNGHLAVVRRLFADDHSEERGLAGTVRPDQSHLFAGIELERRVDEKHLPAVLLADARKRNHASSRLDVNDRAMPVIGSVNARLLAINWNGRSPSCLSLIVG